MTDKDCPNFDIIQDIQSQDIFSTTQFNIMGYKSDALKSQLMENKIWERQATATTVTAPQTCKRQEAIAAANTHGKKVFVTGGKHVTSKDMFKVAGIKRRTLQRPRRWRMARRAGWNITSDARPHCPSLSEW
jgi:hypothetical protein